MGLQNAQTVNIPWPSRGVAQQWPPDEYPQLYAPNARDVRTFNGANRFSGGSRGAWRAWSSTAPVIPANKLLTNAVEAIDDGNRYIFFPWHTSGSSVEGVVRSTIPDSDSGAPVLANGTGSNGILPNAAPFFNQWVQFGNQLYGAGGVDGARRYAKIHIGNNAWSQWTAATAGTLPNNCDLIAVYRGRIFLAESGSQNWFCSRVLDAEDWNYGASPEDQAPVAGASSAVGQPQDKIRALIAYSDDYLIFACDQSIWVLHGDPVTGTLRRLSNTIGIRSQDAWCFDEYGTLWIWDGIELFRLAGSPAIPSPVLNLRQWDQVAFSDIQFLGSFLAYDNLRKQVFVSSPFTIPIDNDQVNIVYDVLNDGLWFDTPGDAGFAGGIHSAFVQLNGNTQLRRGVMLVTDDGYAYVYDHRRSGDENDSADNESIRASIDFAPISLGNGTTESHCTELRLETFNNTSQDDFGRSAIDWYWMVGESASQVINMSDSEAQASGTVFTSQRPQDDGYTPTDAINIGLSARGAWHQLRLRRASVTDANLRSRTPMNLGEIKAVMHPVSKPRRGRP